MTTLVCTSCLGEVSPFEVNGQESPCCQALISDQEWETRVEAFDYYEWYLQQGLTSSEDRFKVLKHVQSMSSNSKKRRKTYVKPSDVWPGRLSPSTSKRAMLREKANLSKDSPTPQAKTISLDITSVDNVGWTVEIIGLDKNPITVSSRDRKDARKKARACIRGYGTSITVASQIIEEEGKTEIHFT